MHCVDDKSTPQARQVDVVLQRAISTGIYVATPPGHKLRSHPLDPRSGQVPPYAMTAFFTGILSAHYHGRSTRWHVTHQINKAKRTRQSQIYRRRPSPRAHGCHVIHVYHAHKIKMSHYRVCDYPSMTPAVGTRPVCAQGTQKNGPMVRKNVNQPIKIN